MGRVVLYVHGIGTYILWVATYTQAHIQPNSTLYPYILREPEGCKY